ncbi:MAG: diguanylate cyclase [Thermodesulfobacteriota bacterium]
MQKNRTCIEPTGISDGMEKRIKTVTTGSLDLTGWRAFQEGLSGLLGIPVSLYDSGANLLAASAGTDALCRAVQSHVEGGPLCARTYANAVAQVIERGKTYIYKCHINKYIFAVPVDVSPGLSVVVVGGQAYLSGNEREQYISGMAHLGLDESSVASLGQALRTIPPKSVFTLPTIIKNLSAPLLKCIYNHTGPVPGQKEGGGESQLNILDQVYRSIAPVLDREELYEAILAKSSELVDADRGSLMILDNKNDVLSIKASKGIDPRIIDSLRVRVGEGISGAIVAKGLPVIVKDIESEVPSWTNRPLYKTKSFLSVPLKLDERVIGVINVSDKSTGASFSDHDMELLLSFASFASIALERGAYYSMSEELKMLSMTDPLTGLFNRRYLRERLYEEVERVKRHSECFSTFLIDIDNFKSFNDRFGHSAGDEILKGISHTIRDAVRSMDVVARYGGEEFAVILPHTGKRDASIIAERIREDVEEYRRMVKPFKEWPTISLGVAEFPNDANDIDELINKADSAMYHAKRTGKNKVVVYEG